MFGVEFYFFFLDVAFDKSSLSGRDILEIIFALTQMCQVDTLDYDFRDLWQ